MTQTNILIVIDPTAEEHPAHSSIVELQKRKPRDSHLTLLFTIDPDGVDTSSKNANVCIDAELVSRLEAPFKEINLPVTTKISWCHEWTAGILQTAEQANATFIAVSHPGKEKTHLADNYWKLIRTTQTPLLVINRHRSQKSDVVVMSMDLQDNQLVERNKRIFEAAERTASLWDAELHLVNAYSDSVHYPDRSRIVNLTGLPNENIHLVQGEPNDALTKITEELNPALVVFGATRRSTGIRAALRGVKVARVFNQIEHDIMIVT